MRKKIFSVVGLVFLLVALSLATACGGGSSSSSSDSTTSGSVSGSAN